MEVVRIAAGFTIAVAAGAAVTTALTDPRDVAPTPALAGAATAGALTYCGGRRCPGGARPVAAPARPVLGHGLRGSCSARR